jgi:hypothetical protein
LSALLGPMLVFITGIAVPLGLLLPPDTMSYPRMLAFAQNFIGKGFIFASSRSSCGTPRTGSFTACTMSVSTPAPVPSCSATGWRCWERLLAAYALLRIGF